MCVVVVASVHRWNCLRRLAHHPQPLRLDASCLRGVGKCKKDREARGFTGPHSLDAPPSPRVAAIYPGLWGGFVGCAASRRKKQSWPLGADQTEQKKVIERTNLKQLVSSKSIIRLLGLFCRSCFGKKKCFCHF
jgi:hypothetical protein